MPALLYGIGTVRCAVLQAFCQTTKVLVRVGSAPSLLNIESRTISICVKKRQPIIKYDCNNVGACLYTIMAVSRRITML